MVRCGRSSIYQNFCISNKCGSGRVRLNLARRGRTEVVVAGNAAAMTEQMGLVVT
jgi:hypothetical protein